MKNILVILLFMISFHASAQSDYDNLTDKETSSPMYKGQITFEDLKKESSFAWLEKGAAAYKPDTAAVAALRKKLPGYEIVVVMGTWCDDSHILVPKLYKTLQAAGYPMAQLSMYAVDRAKQGKNYEHLTYKIDRVPTIILYRGHMEEGRIVETVKVSIEDDMLNIIDKK